MSKRMGVRGLGRGSSSEDRDRVGNPDHVPLQSDFSGSGVGGEAANTHMGNRFGYYIQSAPCRSPFLRLASEPSPCFEAVSTMHE